MDFSVFFNHVFFKHVYPTVSSCLTRTSERIFARAAFVGEFFFFFFIKYDFEAHVRAVISESAATKQMKSVIGAERTATVRQRTTRWGPSVHTGGLTPFSTSESLSTCGSSSQPLRLLLDSISERIQQQKTRQMWNFPHPESLHPATVSFLVYLRILARLSQNSSCSAARCHFSSLCASAQRGSALARTLNPSEPESQSCGDLTCFISNLSEQLVINIMGQS